MEGGEGLRQGEGAERGRECGGEREVIGGGGPEP